MLITSWLRESLRFIDYVYDLVSNEQKLLRKWIKRKNSKNIQNFIISKLIISLSFFFSRKFLNSYFMKISHFSAKQIKAKFREKVKKCERCCIFAFGDIFFLSQNVFPFSLEILLDFTEHRVCQKWSILLYKRLLITS